MTTIIGIQKPDHCLLVADSRITDDSGRTYTHPVVTKITKRFDFNFFCFRLLKTNARFFFLLLKKI